LNSKIHNLSLQGSAGIIFGVLSIIYAFLIYYLISQFTTANGNVSVLPISFFEILLVVISIIFIFISYIIVVLINRKRRRKRSLKGWEIKSKIIRRVYLIHIIFGGIIGYTFMNYGLIKLILPTSLILYGISSIIVNKNTSGKTNYLGILFLINGLLSILFSNQLFLFWGLAFGIYHIIYGIVYYKQVNLND
jgi:hypothetical protein